MKFNKKLLGVMAISLILGACGEKKEVVTGEVQAPAQKLSYNLGSDPKTIDPQLNTAVDGSIVASNIFEGLYSEGDNGATVAAVAESVTVSEDGTKYVFNLRKDAKWSDGKPVTAQDFVYSWKRGLNPDTAMEYAYQLYYLKNGEKYYNGEVLADEIGVKALDDTTLEVSLETATPYFLSLTAFPAYFPLREDIVATNPHWAHEPKTYIGNGPFKLSAWSPKESLTLVPNENYWDRDKVKLSELTFNMIVDEKTYLGAFQTGEVDIIDSPPISEISTLLKDKVAEIHPYLGTYYYVVNVSGNQEKTKPEVTKFLGNPKVRQALSLAVDRKLLVEQVTKGGQLPAKGFVPEGVVATDGKDFATSNSFLPETADIALAKKLLVEAGYENSASIPKISFTYNTSDAHGMVAQAIQDMWKKNLGVDIELKNEEWAVFQDTRSTQSYDIARHGWIADYNDPMTFLDLWVTGGGNNDAGYSNPKYDELIKEAQKTSDPAKRTQLLHSAEAVLLEDAPIIPLYYYTSIVAANPKAKGWVKSPLGGYFFKTAYME